MKVTLDKIKAGIAIHKKITGFLFYNPWCSEKTVSVTLGMNEWDLRLLKDERLYERLRVPSISKRGYQDVYALKALAQKLFFGVNRHPRYLADAFLMQYNRLEYTREKLTGYHQAKLISWSISPWRPGRSGLYFDALFPLNLSPGRSILTIMANPIPDGGLNWLLDLLKVWSRWRHQNQDLPALLFLNTPILDRSSRRYLAEYAPWLPNSFVGYHAPDSGKPGQEPIELLWPTKARSFPPQLKYLPTAPTERIRQDDFITDARQTPFRSASSLERWSTKSVDERAASIQFFLHTCPSEIINLKMIAQFPGLPLKFYQQLDARKKAMRNRPAVFSDLFQAGLVIEAEDLPGYYFPTEKGLTVLGHLFGIKTETANQYLGWPLRPNQLRVWKEHQEVVTNFMLRLIAEKRLLDWNYNNVRFVFEKIQPHSFIPKKYKHVIILPDSTGILRLKDNRLGRFWLEVDRGTRQGERLVQKLEKYFVIWHSTLASTLIPPLVYIVDVAQGHDWTRLETVVRILEALGKKYDRSPCNILLTTGLFIENAPGPLSQATIWLRFFEERCDPGMLVSLLDGIEKGLAQPV